MKFVTQSDGSLVFETPVSFSTGSYYQDPENPCRYIPKYEPCVKRRFELKTLQCGRCVGNWKCDKFEKTTSVPECRGCDAREPE